MVRVVEFLLIIGGILALILVISASCTPVIHKGSSDKNGLVPGNYNGKESQMPNVDYQGYQPQVPTAGEVGRPDTEDPILSNGTEEEPEIAITVYAYSNHVEPKHKYRIEAGKNCRNLDRKWLKRVSSVDVEGNCVQLCHYRHCRGSCIKLSPTTPHHNRLRLLNFDKKTASLKRCTS